MKFNWKTLILVFLVALLGAGIGTFGILEIHDNEKKTASLQNLEVQTVAYDPVSESSYTKAINKAYDTVVEITAKSKTQTFFGTSDATGMGSGVIVSEDGYIVTNHHVINGAYDVSVKLSNGESYPAEIVGSDSRTDTALIKIEAKGLSYANFVDSDSLAMGQEVIVIGNPLGQGVTCSTGIISSLEKEVYLNNVYMDLIQTDASVNEGNSGGGMFDIYGNLVGLINAKSSSSSYSSAIVEGMGYAIPANRVLWVINSLKEYGYVKDRPTLGISVVTGYSNSYFYMTSEEGVLIGEVFDGGGAKEAGMQANDRILSVDGTAVNSYAALNKVLDDHQIGDTVKVEVLRGEEKITFDVTLKEATR